jgi:hypothetical protein
MMLRIKLSSIWRFALTLNLPLRQITFPVASPEIPDAQRDDLLNVFMGEALILLNLPANMVNGEFQGFVEGWTWTASLNQLNLTLNVSPIGF